MIVINGDQYAKLIVEPGKEYNLTFDYAKQPVIQVDDSAQMNLNRVFFE